MRFSSPLKGREQSSSPLLVKEGPGEARLNCADGFFAVRRCRLLRYFAPAAEDARGRIENRIEKRDSAADVFAPRPSPAPFLPAIPSEINSPQQPPFSIFIPASLSHHKNSRTPNTISLHCPLNDMAGRVFYIYAGI